MNTNYYGLILLILLVMSAGRPLSYNLGVMKDFSSVTMRSNFFLGVMRFCVG